jgi:hypothetical protein
VAAGGICATGGIKVTSASGDVYVCNGAQGPQGPQGIQGPAGPTGATGPQGPAGTVVHARQLFTPYSACGNSTSVTVSSTCSFDAGCWFDAPPQAPASTCTWSDHAGSPQMGICGPDDFGCITYPPDHPEGIFDCCDAKHNVYCGDWVCTNDSIGYTAQ